MKKYIVLGCFIAGLWACGSKNNTPTTVTGANGEVIELPEFDSLGRENFEAFYIRFLRDSVFQLERIQFPLPVVEDFAFRPGAVPVLWEAKDWSIQRETGDPSIESHFQDLGSMIAEHIYISKMYYMRRDFAYNEQKKQWQLYSYTAMQELASIQDPSRPQTLQPSNTPDLDLVVNGDTLQ